MARDFTVRARIQAKDEATPTVRKAERSFAGLLSTISTKTVAAVAAGVAAFRLFTSAISAAVRAAQEQQDAVSALNAALDTLGPSAGAASKQLQEHASALQSVTTTGDEAILRMTALALGFTKSADAAAKLVSAALDFSAGAGISFEEATRRLGRSLSGSVDDVAKFVTEIKDLDAATLAAGGAIELIGERFGGVAAAQAQTFSGRIQSLKNSFGDFLGTIGDGIIKNKEFNDALESMTRLISDPNLINSVVTLTTQFATLTGAIASAIVKVGEWSRAAFEFQTANDTYIAGLDGTRESFDKLQNATSNAATATDGLTEAQRRNREENERGSKQRQTDLEEARKLAEQLGVTLERDLVEAEKKEAEALGRLHQLYIKGVITAQDLATAKATQAEAARELAPAIEFEAAAMASANSSASSLLSTQRQLTTETRRAGEAAVVTSRQFDALAASSGRAAAVEAAVAGGGFISNAGSNGRGGRVRLPGGGSRLIQPGL